MFSKWDDINLFSGDRLAEELYLLRHLLKKKEEEAKWMHVNIPDQRDVRYRILEIRAEVLGMQISTLKDNILELEYYNSLKVIEEDVEAGIEYIEAEEKRVKESESS